MKALAAGVVLLTLLPNAAAVPHDMYKGSDCTTSRYLRHNVSCLRGTVSVCSGDICGRPSDYDLDDEIIVELRDKNGTKVLESKKVVVEVRKTVGTTQDKRHVPVTMKVRAFSFTGKRDGDYQLAFILYKNGVPQPAMMFPTNYSHKRHGRCEPVYMVEPTCAK